MVGAQLSPVTYQTLRSRTATIRTDRNAEGRPQAKVAPTSAPMAFPWRLAPKAVRFVAKQPANSLQSLPARRISAELHRFLHMPPGQTAAVLHIQTKPVRTAARRGTSSRRVTEAGSLASPTAHSRTPCLVSPSPARNRRRVGLRTAAGRLGNLAPGRLANLATTRAKKVTTRHATRGSSDALRQALSKGLRTHARRTSARRLRRNLPRMANGVRIVRINRPLKPAPTPAKLGTASVRRTARRATKRLNTFNIQKHRARPVPPRAPFQVRRGNALTSMSATPTMAAATRMRTA